MPARLVLLVLLGLVVLGGCGRSERGPADPAAARRHIDAAMVQINQANFDWASPLFEKAMREAEEGSELWQQAVFGAAVCAQQISPTTRGRIESAEALYKQLLEKTPGSALAPRAMMNLGRIQKLSDYNDDRIDLAAARGWYLKVAEKWPAEPIAGEAVFRAAGAYVQSYESQQVHEGVALLERWLGDHPDEPLAAMMWQYVAETYFYPLKDYRRCLAAYDTVDRMGWPDAGNQGKDYWRIAVMAERDLGDRESAARYYSKIIRETPNSGKAYEAQQALMRLGAPVPEMGVFGGVTTAPAAPAPASAPAATAPAARKGGTR